MEISNILIKTIGTALDSLFKNSGAKIRVHGAENIPDDPVLYVVNHFTRMETVFIPYLVQRTTGKFPISLAHYSFFGGGLGNLMVKLGAISTRDPERDNLMIKCLLTDENPVVIFPEGQMIKDKKIIEKGKYMVYNVGIRRPPHSGAARTALVSQFYREKIRFLQESGNQNAVQKIMERFGITDSTEDVLNRETYIVPVNITYYPVRARDNSINKIIQKFSKEVSPRLEEELLVEGTMLLEGVDIDVTFGEPILIKKYLFDKGSIRKMISNHDLYLDGELSDNSHLTSMSLKLMQRYMECIYTMTTVNHDHIFSYILAMYPKNRIDETDFKNRANLAIEKIKELGISNFHSSLIKKQDYLNTDDFHSKYGSFVEAAESAGLVTLRDGCIIRNGSKFQRIYKFHSVRKDNIVEVLKNEIEPIKGLIKWLHRIMLMSPFFLRRKIRKRFIAHDREIFLDDYKQYKIPGESKPTEIGSPFFFKRCFSERGVILVHGYMAAPEEIRVLADFLYGKGYTVYGVRLRGHGTSPEDLAERNWDEWYESVNRGYVVMKNTVRDFAIVGFSTGAGLALLQAANKKNRFKCIVSINAPLHLQNIASRLSSAVVVWNNFLSRFKLNRGKMEYITNTPENPNINYFRNPVRGVSELEKLMKTVEERLPDVDTPTMIVQGSNDPIVNPASGLEIFDKLGTADKELCRIYANRHGIVRGKEFDRVAARVLAFLEENFRKK
ncbi:MAG: alpha/beta fold hydrolase [Spirochaetes bacterium]|jgi:esterase/lipase/1-acyl-sn-glycerol-3-phosphate acyltransferase|nr:alpha/beta fold hydrolase [Spirochaetota bacterium]